MNKFDVIHFFDHRASTWDETITAKKNDAVIRTLLDNAEVGEGQEVLDVACGTGVLVPFYRERGVAHITAIDISSEMIRVAHEKYGDAPDLTLLCGDVEEQRFEKKFDRIVVYNAFPHFPEPKRLIRSLADLLKEGGRLTICHGSSRAVIDGHHNGPAANISNGLMAAEDLVRLFTPYIDVEIMISNSRMYQVSGTKKKLFGPEEHDHAHDHSHEVKETEAPTSMAHTLALMQFMVAHNDAHSQELADLAADLLTAGKERAHHRIMEAVADFDVANAKLDFVLNELREEEE